MRLRLLFRYQLRELLLPLGAWVGFLYLLLFLLFFLRGTEVLMGTAARGADVARLALALSPQFLVTCLPLALLLAVLFGLGRLGEDGELAALQALGCGPARLAAAPLGLAAAVSLALGPLSFWAMPHGLVAVRELANDVILRNVADGIRPGAFYDGLAGRTLFVEASDEARQRWRRVFLFDDSDAEGPSVLLAQEGGARPGRSGRSVELWLERGELVRQGAGDESAAPVAGAERAGREPAAGVRAAGEPLAEAPRPVIETLRVAFERARLQVELKSSAMGRLSLWGDASDAQTPGELLGAARSAAERGADPRGPLTALHGRIAQVVSPLAFALVATPLAAGRRAGGRARPFLLAMSAYSAYFVVLKLVQRAALQLGAPPLLAAHAANVAFALVGAALLWRLHRRGWRS